MLVVGQEQPHQLRLQRRQWYGIIVRVIELCRWLWIDQFAEHRHPCFLTSDNLERNKQPQGGEAYQKVGNTLVRHSPNGSKRTGSVALKSYFPVLSPPFYPFAAQRFRSVRLRIGKEWLGPQCINLQVSPLIVDGVGRNPCLSLSRQCLFQCLIHVIDNRLFGIIIPINTR